jgi:hypothetical protein
MVYGVITLKTKPGKRFAGIDHLKAYAKWLSDKYGTPTQVLGNGGGLIYENHILCQFESLAQMDEVNSSAVKDPEFQQWFTESEGLLEWKDSTWRHYDVWD